MTCKFCISRSVLELLSEANAPQPFKVGEIFILEGLAKRRVEFLLNVLHFWANHKAIICTDRPLSPTYNASTSHDNSVVQLVTTIMHFNPFLSSRIDTRRAVF